MKNIRNKLRNLTAIGVLTMGIGCGKINEAHLISYDEASLYEYLSMPIGEAKAIPGDNAIFLARRTAVGFPYSSLKEGFRRDNATRLPGGINNISSGREYVVRIGTNSLSRTDYLR